MANQKRTAWLRALDRWTCRMFAAFLALVALISAGVAWEAARGYPDVPVWEPVSLALGAALMSASEVRLLRKTRRGEWE